MTTPSPVSSSPDIKSRPPLVVVTDEVDSAVQEAWNVANRMNVIDKAVNHTTVSSGEIAGDAASTPKLIGANLNDGLNTDINLVKNRLRNFRQASELLMKGLDEIVNAPMYSFVSVTVIAFKAVLTLELKRRENDNKVLALHLEMNDTVGILLQLRTIRDPMIMAPDGSSIFGRMQGILQRLTEDIKNCGNVCDKYMKKSTIAKVLKAPIYEQKLADCAEAFALRRRELKTAMAVRITLGIDAAIRSLDSMQTAIKNTEDKLSMLLVLQKLSSPRDRDFMKWVEANGGADAVIKDDELLKKLQKKMDSTGTPSPDSAFQAKGNDSAAIGVTTSNVAERVRALRKEIKEDFDDELSKNMVLFERKLDIQSQQLTVQMRIESNRVIHAFRSGAHEKIVDNTLRQLWKEMGWKGSVKARQLVLCLHEFFCEKHDQKDERHHANFLAEVPLAPSPTVSVVSDNISDDDAWALEYINVVHVPPIIENIDDNVSGFVSIKEANTFALARPPGWSFPHWLAFWAAAWPQSIGSYRGKISVIIQRMFGSLPSIRSENRQSLEEYLYYPIRWIEYILRSVNTSAYASSDAVLLEKTRSYVESEEKRMKETLESIHYDIDAPSTVSLVTGPGRIEKFLFPLLYLVLLRHLKIFKLAESHCIPDEDLQTMRKSLENCLAVISRRLAALTPVFKQSASDVTSKYRSFAFGMFELFFNNGGERDHRLNHFTNEYDDDGSLDEHIEAIVPSLADNHYGEVEKQATPFEANEKGHEDKKELENLDQEEEGMEQKGCASEQNIGEEGEGVCEDPVEGDEITEDAHEQPIGTDRLAAAHHNDSGSGSFPKDGECGEEDSQIAEEVSQVTDEHSAIINSALPPPVPQNLAILKNTPQYPVDFAPYETPRVFEFTPPHDDSAQWPQVIEGTWCCYRDFSEQFPKAEITADEGLTTFFFDSVVDNVISGSALSHYGFHILSGSIDGDDSEPFAVHFSKVCTNPEYDSYFTSFVGKFNPEKEIITGTWSFDGIDKDGTFVLSRTPTWLQRYRVRTPTGSIGRDLWTFALNAVLAQVRRNLFSWEHINARAEDRKAFLAVNIKRRRLFFDYAPRVELTTAESVASDELGALIAPYDGHLYHSIVDRKMRQLVVHNNSICDTCRREPAGLRLICVQCALPTYRNQLDLCTACRDTLPTTSDFNHKTDHDLMLTANFLQDWDKARTFEAAKEKAMAMKIKFKQMLASPPAPLEFEASGAFGILCACCKKSLALPCWACFTCDNILCDDCGLKDVPFEPEHRYVRLHEGNVVGKDVDHTDKTLEAKVKAYEDILQEKLVAYHSTMDSRLQALEERMTSIESLLKILVANSAT